MMLYICILLYLPYVYSRVEMVNSDFEKIKTHVIPQSVRHNISNDMLKYIVKDEWLKLVSQCPELDPNANIKAEFDNTLIGTSTLAWASQTLLLKDLSYWVPSIATLDFFGHDFMIGVNPQPPNGWYTSENCDSISYRYDLRTVLRHEILHGIGVGSSLKNNNGWTVGHTWNGICFPRYFDTLIVDNNGNKVVTGCTINQDITGKNVYINGVKIFNPSYYMQGSSMSHHVYQGELMYYMLPPMECLELRDNEFKILSALGLRCPGKISYSSAMAYVSLKLLPISLMLLLFLI
jgi:hypothetical protein